MHHCATIAASRGAAAMIEQYRLRLQDGTVLTVDHGGLRSWLMDERTMVQPPGSQRWRPLKKFLAEHPTAPSPPRVEPAPATPEPQAARPEPVAAAPAARSPPGARGRRARRGGRRSGWHSTVEGADGDSR